MSKLFLKTQEIDTIRDERLALMQSGTPVIAGGLNSPTARLPRVEAAGVSFVPGIENINGRDAHAINNLPAVALHGGMRNDRVIAFSEMAMPSFGGRTIGQAYADGTMDQFMQDVRMDGNSLLADWQTLLDATRLNLTVQKELVSTVRELLFDVIDVPNATAIMNVSELYPPAFVFEENTGTGQPVEMGELVGGQNDTLAQRIYATGLTYDLNKYLFDPTLDMNAVNRGIAIAEASKKDDLALSPIFGFTYAAAAKTAAVVDAAATREDLWWRTISNAVSDMQERKAPVTGNSISAMGCSILTSPVDATHVNEVISGFTGAEQHLVKRNAISEISKVIGYEGGRIVGRSINKAYTDVPTGKGYLIVPNRRMLIAIKRLLNLNIDTNPAVLRLAREQLAWWFVEGQYTDGIGYWIQEITWPAW